MAKKSKITVVYKKVGKKPEVIEIDNTLEEMQRLVDGYIEVVPLYPVEYRLAAVCNEEGLLKELPFNCRLFGLRLVGDLIVVATKGDRFVSVPADFAKEMVKEWEVLVGEEGEEK